MNTKLNRIQFPYLLVLFLAGNLLLGQENEEYASADSDYVVILEPEYVTTKVNSDFQKKYHFLVARAYFRLISEAQKAERKLRIEAERNGLIEQNTRNEANVKYIAHSEMLSGLISWNLFSEYRTGDMFYFMAENEDRIFKMYRGNLSEDKMVNYLIYKLADLYHLEREN